MAPNLRHFSARQHDHLQHSSLAATVDNTLVQRHQQPQKLLLGYCKIYTTAAHFGCRSVHLLHCMPPAHHHNRNAICNTNTTSDCAKDLSCFGMQSTTKLCPQMYSFLSYRLILDVSWSKAELRSNPTLKSSAQSSFCSHIQKNLIVYEYRTKM